MSEPVTITVRRKVRPGREAAYEAWLKRLTEGAATDFPGYLGAEFHRPGPDGTYCSVFRFDSLPHLEAFERSDFRAAMLAEGADLFAADAAWERMTGLEFWFDPPPGTKVPQPSPHRMALVLIAVVFVLVLALNLTLGALDDRLALGPARAGHCLHPGRADDLRHHAPPDPADRALHLSELQNPLKGNDNVRCY